MLPLNILNYIMKYVLEVDCTHVYASSTHICIFVVIGQAGSRGMELGPGPVPKCTCMSITYTCSTPWTIIHVL